MAAKLIHVVVQDRSRVLFDGQSTGLTSKNSKGIFDILINHANFITLINETLDIHLPNGGNKSIPMNNAIIKAKENEVQVFVGVKR